MASQMSLQQSVFTKPCKVVGEPQMTSPRTILFHLVLASVALVELAKYLTLSSHLFFCLYFLLFPFTKPCRIVFAKSEDIETWPNHLSFHFLTRDRSSSYSPMAAWTFSSLLHDTCTKCSIAFGSISSQRPAFFSLILR